MSQRIKIVILYCETLLVVNVAPYVQFGMVFDFLITIACIYIVLYSCRDLMSNKNELHRILIWCEIWSLNRDEIIQLPFCLHFKSSF